MPRGKRRRPRNRETRVKLVGNELTLGFEGQGVQEWVDRLGGFYTKSRNLTPFMDRFGDYMLGSIDRNFVAQGRPTRWQPLAPSTIKERQRLGYGASPILQRTQALRRGFRKQTGRSFLRILNNTPYYKYHQQDNRRGSKIPRRIMVVIQNRDKAEFTRLFRVYVGAE